MSLDSKKEFKKICIRMPNWLGDFVMALPLLRSMKENHPHAQLTLIAKPQFKELIKLFPVADEFISLPSGSFSCFRELYSMGRFEKPDCQVLFTNSVRGDLEAWFLGADKRLGMAYPGRYRPFLTYTYRLDSFKGKLNEIHQTNLLEKFLKSVGLINSVNSSPFKLVGTKRVSNRIGIVAGSSNNPQKCWAVDKWCALIGELSLQIPNSEFILFGTASDCQISRAVANGCGVHLLDITGKTNIRELGQELAACNLVVGNDTGGMHLANAVGTPVAVLFGPTNFLVTGPFFAGSKLFLQPEGCPREGGSSIQLLDSNDVVTRLMDFLKGDFVSEGEKNVD